MGRLWYDYIQQIAKRWIQPLEWRQSANYEIHAKVTVADNNDNATSLLPSQRAFNASAAMYLGVGSDATVAGLSARSGVPHT